MTVRYTVAFETEAMHKHSLRFVAGDDRAFSTAIRADSVQGELSNLLEKIDLLINEALDGAQKRGDLDILEHSKRLRSQIFWDDSQHARPPSERYVSLCECAPFERSVMLDVDGFGASIPWELVWDGYITCLNSPPCWRAPLSPANRHLKCEHDVRFEEGPLALIRHLGMRHHHWKVDPHPPTPPEQAPTRAFIIADPGNADPEKRLGEAEHLILLDSILRECGYEVKGVFGEYATAEALFKALNDPACGAVYIFAHCKPAEGDLPPRICLHDRELSHHDFRDQIKGRPFIFLNGCWTAKTKWPASAGAIDSLAGALLEEGASAVVGTLCPVVTHQASRAAETFFDEALRASTLGHALSLVRMESYHRYYHHGEADLSWFAYRLYGDPDCCLATRSWNVDGTLRADAFDFDVDQLAERMDEIREERGNALITVPDVLFTVAEAGASGNTALVSIAAQQFQSVFNEIIRTIRRARAKKAKAGLPNQVKEAREPSAAEASRPETAPAEAREPEPEQFAAPSRSRPSGAAAPAVLARSDAGVRYLFSNLLQTESKRNQPLKTWASDAGVERLSRLNLSDFLDACRLAFTSSPQAAEVLEERARRKVRELLDGLNRLPDSMTYGAALVVHRAVRNRRLGGANANPHRALLAALLQDQIIGSHWVMPGEDGLVEELCRQLGMSPGEPLPSRQLRMSPGEPLPKTDDFVEFVEELLRRAGSITTLSEESRIDVRHLFIALCEMAGWPAFEERKMKH